MTKKLITSIAALLLCASLTGRAQDTNMAAMTNMATTNAAPAAAMAAPAAPTSNSDPSGANTTGTSSDVPGFVVSEPTALMGDDLKDTNKVAAYATAKKAFDDYTAQAAKEPLAVSLANTVGHNKMGINFVWTLVTGFLVMFMPAREASELAQP